MNDEILLERLNGFTRREFTAEEVYIFPVLLCDNEIDRDNERFSLEALGKMAELFVGVTGIFDHNPKGSNQTARLFFAEVSEDTEKTNSLGEAYACLKGYAYMVRTESNADLIREIDGGIKKEVSVSCRAKSRICSVCGADVSQNACRHIKGNTYGEKLCFHTLEDISDAYEWSFVAVPAQVRAGVTKGHGDTQRRSELEGRIRRALLLENADGKAVKFFEAVKDKLELSELEELGKKLAVGRYPEKTADLSEYML
ncbi:MAG: hypothetical protein J6C96_09685 [Oscillospiraceae bacterium]|nr:hypothetical protein [Oscillospiraceae bacterium]